MPNSSTSTPAGNALLDHQLYLPEAWAADAERGKKTRVPTEITFQTKPQIAAALVARSTVAFDWVTADEQDGRNGAFLDALEQGHQRDLVEVPCDATLWTTKPMGKLPTRSSVKSPPWPRHFLPERGTRSRSVKERRGRWPSSLLGSGSGRSDIAVPVRRWGC